MDSPDNDTTPPPFPHAPYGADSDVCTYCGADNGPRDPETGRGVSREGYDCYYCKGN